MLVVAHVHYPELWADIEERLSRIPEPYDLIVSVTQGHGEKVAADIRNRFPDALVEVVPNQGRDWAPLISLANRGLLSGYRAIAKVHTKKSEHRHDGAAWRLDLLDGVLSSPESIAQVISLLAEDRNVGIVVPSGHVSGPEHWGSNLGAVEALAYRLSMAFDPDALAFPAGSMFWCQPWLLERLADLNITLEEFEVEAGQYDGTTAHALERIVGVVASVAGLQVIQHLDVGVRLRELRRSPLGCADVYCFYLPQFHRSPANDQFWGAGFTDWDNVKSAQPFFPGHRQPLLPDSETGFYDLADPEVLRQQWSRAREHGLSGFVFHYYWFDGYKALDKPLSNWLADPSIDMPLALCWANEPWTRRWDGQDQEVLIPQIYGPDWEHRFWDDISPIVADPRYIRWADSPVLVLYRPGQIPDLNGAVEIWRKRAADDGHPGLQIVGVAVPREEAPWPHSLRRALDHVLAFPPGSGVHLVPIRSPAGQPLLASRPDAVLSYDAAFSDSLWREGEIPCVFPGWDNTARRGPEGYVFLGANPITFRRHLEVALRARPEGPIFINAWNEWAEGAALEAWTTFGGVKEMAANQPRSWLP